MQLALVLVCRAGRFNEQLSLNDSPSPTSSSFVKNPSLTGARVKLSKDWIPDR